MLSLGIPEDGFGNLLVSLTLKQQCTKCHVLNFLWPEWRWKTRALLGWKKIDLLSRVRDAHRPTANSLQSRAKCKVMNLSSTLLFPRAEPNWSQNKESSATISDEAYVTSELRHAKLKRIRRYNRRNYFSSQSCKANQWFRTVRFISTDNLSLLTNRCFLQGQGYVLWQNLYIIKSGFVFKKEMASTVAVFCQLFWEMMIIGSSLHEFAALKVLMYVWGVVIMCDLKLRSQR